MKNKQTTTTRKKQRSKPTISKTDFPDFDDLLEQLDSTHDFGLRRQIIASLGLKARTEPERQLAHELTTLHEPIVVRQHVARFKAVNP